MNPFQLIRVHQNQRKECAEKKITKHSGTELSLGNECSTLKTVASGNISSSDRICKRSYPHVPHDREQRNGLALSAIHVADIKHPSTTETH